MAAEGSAESTVLAAVRQRAQPTPAMAQRTAIPSARFTSPSLAGALSSSTVSRAPDQSSCTARVYRYSSERPPRAGGAQQRLVDRMSRHHWQSCGAACKTSCTRCQAPLCDEHIHHSDKRCSQCETEFRAVVRNTNATLVIGYCALVFAVGVASMALGYRSALLLVIPTLAAAPLVARLGRQSWVRRRFLRETRRRPAHLPRAWSRPG